MPAAVLGDVVGFCVRAADATFRVMGLELALR
jgi:hypothetical protein